MRFRDEALHTAVIAVGVASLLLGALSARLSDSLVVSGVTSFIVIVGLSLLLRAFFSSWALERYAANPAYKTVLARHSHRVGRASLVMSGLAFVLAVIAFVANSPAAAIVAGMLAGLPVLGLTMKSAFDVEVVNP